MKLLQLFGVSATLLLIAHGQQQNPGFISIDCGAEKDYYDYDLEIYYKTDRGFISSGVNHHVSSEVAYDNKVVQSKNLRAFPNGTRNCYKLTPQQGKGKTYLIRASFWYGNYDGRNQAPSFDLYIDVNYWATISTESFVYEEVIYVPPRDDIHVCLVNTGLGVPFISALDLRLLNNSVYGIDSGALRTSWHYDIGGDRYSYRHPDDVYDRIWKPSIYDWVKIANETVVDLTAYDDAYRVPVKVLTTAGRSYNVSWNLRMYWEPSSPTKKWYVYFHFMEIQVLQNQVREIEVYVVDQFVKTVRPQFGEPETVAYFPVTSPSQINFTLKASSLSDLPPILNAVEAMSSLDLTNPMTEEDDVNAINDIKNSYGMAQDSWQGDPCSPPNFSWRGLNCSYDGIPRIMSLNMSSSNLMGEIADAFLNLTALTSLDLSNNQLTGQIPEFFGQMPYLKLLNLSGNNLSGSIPQALKRKQAAGVLQASFDGNPSLCQTGSCGEKGQSSIILIVAVSVSVFVGISLCMLTILRRIKRRRREVAALIIVSVGSNEGPLVLGVPRKRTVFKSSEISTITKNFGTVIGEGGFGKVYLGILDNGTKVAVKISSKSSVQGYREFLAEAQLLMTVHHRNLVSLVGYCDDIENMALIYEFMSYGNLKQHLSENNANVLSWSQRLQIAVDVAQGLEYLHNGCKPPIIHRDMKTSNILLNESIEAKIADFGLSKSFATDNDSHVTTRPAGTLGYLDPEFRGSGNLTKKSDVYSFGIIMMELITGQPAVKRNCGNSLYITDWITPLIERGDIESIVDSKLSGKFNINTAWRAVEIAISCVIPSSSERPDMNSISSDLKECLRLEIYLGYNNGAVTGASVEIPPDELDISPIPR